VLNGKAQPLADEIQQREGKQEFERRDAPHPQSQPRGLAPQQRDDRGNRQQAETRLPQVIG